MFKTAITALVLIGTVSGALATEFDANLGNRYPQVSAMQSKAVSLPTNQTVPAGNWMDQASQSFGGGY